MIGKRRYRATIQQHNGTQDSHGNPTYTTPGDWDTVVADWPVQMLAVSGGEAIRGRQVSNSTTHVLYGEFQGGKDIGSDMRAKVEGVTYDVIDARDEQGTRREIRVEMKHEEQ